jgi:NADPH:quinone reductase-like Zn-dependent oxidoreductase
LAKEPSTRVSICILDPTPVPSNQNHLHDQVIDYIESDPRTAIAKGTVDFLFDTTGDAMTHLSLMRPQSGCIVSVATMPSGTELQESPLMELPDSPRLAMPVKMVLDFLDWVRKVRARRYGVEYSYLLLGSSGEDLDALRGYVEDGKVRTVVGDVVKLRDIEGIRRICSVVYSGKGGLGKSVVKVI